MEKELLEIQFGISDIRNSMKKVDLGQSPFRGSGVNFIYLKRYHLQLKKILKNKFNNK